MPTGTLHYRLRIRTGTDEADLLSVTSVPDGLNPYIAEPPSGDGTALDPLTGKVSVGAYTVRVIDVPGVVYQSSGGALTDGWEYANQAAAEAAGWVFTDTLPSGTITVGAVDQVHGGTKSLKMALTNNPAGSGVLRAQKTFDGGDGIVANTLYAVSIYARMDARSYWDVTSRLIVNGVESKVNTSGVWELLTVTVRASENAELAVTLERKHSFVRQNRTVWWDDFSIQGLSPSAAIEGRVVTSVLADADARQQLLSKPAFVEESEDGGATWAVVQRGYINRAAMLDALLWEFTVGDSRRVEQSKRVFDQISDPVEHPEFIGTLDRASCIMGGPIVRDWGGIYQDRGRPAFRVADDLGADVLKVAWTNDGGSVHAVYGEDGPPLTDSVTRFFNECAREYLDPDALIQGDSLQFALAPGLICRIYDYDTSSWLRDETCVLTRLGSNDWGFVQSSGEFFIRWTGTLPSEGDKYRFAVFPRAISERNPAHWSGHPMDLVANILDYIGTPYDLTSLQAIGEALGLDLRIHLRITQGDTAQQFLENTVYGPFGVGARINDDGEVEFFLSRDPDTTSAVTVTEDDIAGELDGTPWVIEESSAANRVIVETQKFQLDERRDTGTPFDAIRTAKITTNIKAQDQDEQEVFGDKEVRFTLPGSIQIGNAILAAGTQDEPGTLDLWAEALARPLFDWQGRGAIRAELDLRRGVTDAKIGDVITLDLGYFPSANPAQSPVSQRGTDTRRAVILKRTVQPDRVALLLEDRGLGEALACAPEFTLAADAAFPKTTVEVEVTNEDDLDHPLRVEMAQGASEPAGNGQFVRRWRPNLDANPFDLPPVCAGNVVWVRMRCELNGQVGDWTAWQSLDLADLTPPSDLAAVVTNTSIALTWTNGETAYPIEVLARLDADTTLQSVTILPAGSTSYTLLLTEAETDYVVGVRYVDPKGCTSSTTTVSAATDVAICLEPPANLAAFADGAGTYGVELSAIVVPGGVDIWVATETAVGSATPGTYAFVTTVAALAPPLRTRWTASSPAPNDGLLRYIKAESSQAGYTACGFSAVVSVNPWTVVEPNNPGDDTDTDLPDDGNGLITAIVDVPLLTIPYVIFEPGADRAELSLDRVDEEYPDLTGATAVWLTAQVAATSAPVGVYVACEFENLLSSADWHPPEDDDEDATLDGPKIALDSASLDTLDPNAAKAAWNVRGEAVAPREESRDRVRVRLVHGGGDGTGAVLLSKVVLWVQYGPRVILPPETPDPAPEDPGSCDAPGDLVATYADQATAFAAEPED